MASFLVFEPDGLPDARTHERARFVRDRFSLLALIFPPLWLLWHGLVIEALLAVVLVGAAGAAAEFAGLGAAASMALSLLFGLYVALEGPSLRAAALLRRGWLEWGVVEADSVRDAEIRYAAEVAGTKPLPAPPLLAPSRQPAPLPRVGNPPGPALGLFDYPGR